MNCVTAELRCTFLDATGSASPSGKETSSLADKTSPNSDNSNSRIATPDSQQDARLSREPPQPVGEIVPLNLPHMALFYQFITETYKMYGAVEEKHIPDIIMRYALVNPFLMYEILAITALQLSVTEPARRAFHHQQSAELLGQALASFHEISKNLNEDTIGPAFLFSGLIGVHFFAETFNQSSGSHMHLDAFLDQLVHSIKVLRGVRAILGDWWSFLLKSELKPLIDLAQPPDDPPSDETTQQLEALKEMIRESPTLSREHFEAYEGAIDQLVLVHRLEVANTWEGHVYRDSRRAMAWPITVSAAYTELLAQRQPEALVILAHYAVRLEKCRSLWAIGTAGEVLLSSIEEYLAPVWRKWLAWPASQILRDDHRT